MYTTPLGLHTRTSPTFIFNENLPPTPSTSYKHVARIYLKNGVNKLPYLFLHHAVLRVVTLKMEAEETGPVEHIFEVPEADFAERLVDGGHEGRHCPLREVDHFGRCLLRTYN